MNRVCERGGWAECAKQGAAVGGPQGKPRAKAIGPTCPFPKGLTQMRGLLCRPGGAWGLPRASPALTYPMAFASNASR